MFWLLFEQNSDVRNNIKQYKERYLQKNPDEKPGSNMFIDSAE